MRTTVSPIRPSLVLAAAALGAMLLFVAGRGAAAHSEGSMENMEGMHCPAASAFAFGEPGKVAEVGRTVNITMKDLSFEPAALRVKVGETIRFVVTNRGAVDHDFTIGDAAAQADHRQEMAEIMAKGGEMHHGDDANAISVNAGETREMIWKFTRPARLEFDCNIPGHYEAGMAGVITVVGKAEGSPGHARP